MNRADDGGAVRGPGAVWLAAVAAVAVIAGLSLGSFCISFWLATAQSADQVLCSPTEVRLEELQEIATIKVTIGKLINIKDVNRWGTIEGRWVIQGDALLSTDMSKAKLTSCDSGSHTVSISLPQPRVIQARVLSDQTRQYDMSVDLLRTQEVANEMRGEVMKKGQAFIGDEAGAEDHIALAREQLETALQGMFQFIGWKAEFVWEGRH